MSWWVVIEANAECDRERLQFEAQRLGTGTPRRFKYGWTVKTEDLEKAQTLAHSAKQLPCVTHVYVDLTEPRQSK